VPYNTANFSHTGFRSEVHLVLRVDSCGGVDVMEGIAVISSHDAAVGVGK
jgi:hypothetical protein